MSTNPEFQRTDDEIVNLLSQWLMRHARQRRAAQADRGDRHRRAGPGPARRGRGAADVARERSAGRDAAGSRWSFARRSRRSPTATSLGAMFTGIVREVGRVASLDGDGPALRLEVEAPETAPGVAIGDSVSISGVCLTAVEIANGRIGFDVVPESLARTSLGGLAAGDRVNVEPALRAGEPLGGHYVQGHVDAVGRVRRVDGGEDGDARLVRRARRAPPLRRREGLDHGRRHEPHRRRRSTTPASRSRSSRTRSPRRRSASSSPATR